MTEEKLKIKINGDIYHVHELKDYIGKMKILSKSTDRFSASPIKIPTDFSEVNDKLILKCI